MSNAIQLIDREFYTAAAQVAIHRYNDAATKIAIDIVLERVYDDTPNRNVTTWMRPVGSAAINPARPHLSHPATAMAAIIDDDTAEVMIHHAYAGSAAPTIARADWAAFGIEC